MRSLARLPRPGYAGPASIAAAFFTAWASIDATHDTQRTYLARCTGSVTPALRRQLATSQPSPAEWQDMRRAQLVSTVHVRAVTHPAGAPPPSRTRVFLRVYAERVTTTPVHHAVTSDGNTVQADRIRAGTGSLPAWSSGNRPPAGSRPSSRSRQPSQGFP